jgi:hypothetical protein
MRNLHSIDIKGASGRPVGGEVANPLRWLHQVVNLCDDFDDGSVIMRAGLHDS